MVAMVLLVATITKSQSISIEYGYGGPSSSQLNFEDSNGAYLFVYQGNQGTPDYTYIIQGSSLQTIDAGAYPMGNVFNLSPTAGEIDISTFSIVTGIDNNGRYWQSTLPSFQMGSTDLDVTIGSDGTFTSAMWLIPTIPEPNTNSFFFTGNVNVTNSASNPVPVQIIVDPADEARSTQTAISGIMYGAAFAVLLAGWLAIKGIWKAFLGGDSQPD